jgi:dipeptidyl aminopeptidase/acylaminoacyl peptidase
MSEFMDRFVAAVASRYRIEREIGSGGMATVYLARDLKHDRDVAVKVLRPELAAVLGINRFLNEIRISAQLDHPHILTLIDSGVAGNPRDSAGGWFPYYVMPFVRGESLRAKLEREKQVGIDDALDITRQVTSALDYAHRHGIVHRDIKPENILIREGEAVLADFGIATAVKEAGGSRLTESGVSLGTPQYMSPEQATGDRVLDARSDVYSIAAVLYEMLAGEPPHTGATVQAVVAKLLTEQPTRLRVVRASVPEAVDEAVAKALAKVPVDRYATAGDFARALTAREAPRQRSMLARRWVPLAVGAGIVAAAASVAAFVLARKPAPPPLPDRVQLTLTGNATSPSLSPDGTRLAFAEKQCDQAGSCTYQLVIQDLDGTRAPVLTRNIGYIFKTQWTRDGRFVVFAGSHPPLRHGAFAVSTLGGETRFLGCCGYDLLSVDTAFLASGMPDSTLVRRITIHDGETVDSIPVRDATARYYVVALTIPDRLVVAMGKTAATAPELRLTDFSGQIIDRITPPFGSLGRAFRARWAPSSQRLVVAAQRELGGAMYDIVTMRVTASGIEPAIDTVLAGLELGDGSFDLSPNGEQLIYYGGPVETSLSTIDVDRAPTGSLAPKQVSFATARLRGRISRTGDRILLASDAPRGGAHASQFSLVPRGGGPESPIPIAVENLVDFHWSPDGNRIMYLQGIGENKVLLAERDTAGGGRREITRLQQSEVAKFYPLPDGALCLLPPDRRSMSIILRPGERPVRWQFPDWLKEVGSVSHSPDAKSLVLEGNNPRSDSVVVAVVDVETGRFTRLAGFAGSDPQQIAWLQDGSLMSIFREPEGAWAMYRIRSSHPPERLGAVPHTRAEFSVSNDGKHVAMFSYRDRNDVYMIRNFGDLLRR